MRIIIRYFKDIFASSGSNDLEKKFMMRLSLKLLLI